MVYVQILIQKSIFKTHLLKNTKDRRFLVGCPIRKHCVIASLARFTASFPHRVNKRGCLRYSDSPSYDYCQLMGEIITKIKWSCSATRSNLRFALFHKSCKILRILLFHKEVVRLTEVSEQLYFQGVPKNIRPLNIKSPVLLPLSSKCRNRVRYKSVH